MEVLTVLNIPHYKQCDDSNTLESKNQTINGNVDSKIGTKADVLAVLKNNMLTANTQEVELAVA